MSAVEIKSEVIRLVSEMDDNLMEDLLSSIKLFVEQQEQSETETNTFDIVTSLNKSLREFGQSDLLSNEEVEKEAKQWLTR